MKYAFSFAQLAAAASLSLAAIVDISSIPRGGTKNTLPNRYVIEVDPETVSVSSISGKRMNSPHAGLYEAMHRRDIIWTTINEFESDVYTGASVALNNEEDLLKLANIQGIVGVHPITVFKRPTPAYQHVLAGPDDPEIPADGESTHIMTGVDKLHAEGNFGQGIKVGVIDTGIDYTHPNLGGCFGEGCKVVGGYDFVGDAYNGTNTPTPDDDPMDCEGHGTHVSGIIGANPGNAYNISGVAYKSDLAMYRVFGCSGGVSDDIIIAALLRAHEENCNVISLSLGGPSGWSSSASSVVASRIAKSGRVVTIAAGNEGADGMFYAASPSSGIDVVSVGSIDNTEVPIQFAKVSDHEDIPYFSLAPLNFTEALPIWAVSNTTVPNDACDPLPDSTPDLSGFVVLIRRGTCTFVQKLTNVAAKGARVALIYNNGGSPNAFAPEPIQGALINTEDGAYLLQQFLAGTPSIVSFPQDGPVDTFPAATGGLVSTFSTYGPTFDAWLKPSVAAPGGGIVSTLPVDQGGFGIQSGTSMATPFVAGVAALLLQVRGATPEVSVAARDLLQTTAKYVPVSKADDALINTASVQGSGLINAYNLIHYTTAVYPGQLLLNDTANFNGAQSFTIKNTGSSSRTYTLSHVPAGTAPSLKEGSIQPGVGAPALTSDFATVNVPQTVTVAAGESQTVEVQFTAPTVDPSAIPVYSGYIEVTSDDGEALSVTYMGIASSLYDAKILDDTEEFFGFPIPAEIDAAGNPATTEQTYTFVGEDYPSILFRLVMGTRSLVFDLVAEDTTLPAAGTYSTSSTTNGGRHNRIWQSIWEWLKNWLKADETPDGSFYDIPTVGPLALFEYSPRHAESPEPEVGFSSFSINNGTFVDGKPIPNGRYKVLLRALKITGELSEQNDYESWLSPVMVFNAASS